MFRKSILSFTTAALLLTLQYAAANEEVEQAETEAVSVTKGFANQRSEFIPFCHRIASTDLYRGDSDGYFIDDLVTVLDDGSAWKIHPDDTRAYSRWMVGDLVQLVARTSFYWFKREHKFMLYNYNANESLRVMLVQYPTVPTYIASFQDIVVGGHWSTTRVLDINNNWISITEWVNDYKRNIYLSDGSVWCVPSDDRFTAGRFIMPGINNDGDRFWYFLGLGLNKESFWIKADRLQ